MEKRSKDGPPRVVIAGEEVEEGGGLHEEQAEGVHQLWQGSGGEGGEEVGEESGGKRRGRLRGVKGVAP